MSLVLALLLNLQHGGGGGGSSSSTDMLQFNPYHVDEAVFIICWCVALTIIVNGSLVSVVLDWLGMAPRENHHDSIMVHYVEARLRLSLARYVLLSLF